ncbi:MAG: DUF1156 domain-containing protein [Planctomycetes bacterium]|nr:DUF1156 domain-containing protein [Planctomycetota bacterium]
MPVRKKRIAVALPLEAIDAAAAREKSIRRGQPPALGPAAARGSFRAPKSPSHPGGTPWPR